MPGRVSAPKPLVQAAPEEPLRPKSPEATSSEELGLRFRVVLGVSSNLGFFLLRLESSCLNSETFMWDPNEVHKGSEPQSCSVGLNGFRVQGVGLVTTHRPPKRRDANDMFVVVLTDTNLYTPEPHSLILKSLHNVLNGILKP